MSDIEALTKRILTFRDEREWRQYHRPKDTALSLMLEAAELAEHFQWKSDDEITEYVKEHRDQIGEELSDVLYWVLLIAADLKIPLIEAFEKKMQINEQKYPISKAKGNSVKYTEFDGPPS